jgi:hypothetical protein
MIRERRVVLIAVILAMLMGLEVVAQATARRAAETEAGPWVPAIDRMDRALAVGDVSAAERAMHEAYVAAMASRRWDGMATVGDAYLRLGAATNYERVNRAKARQAYLTAFFRARGEQSMDGVLRAMEAFSDLGDRAVAVQCLKTAEALASKSKTPGARDRVAGYAERYEARGMAGIPAASGF